MPCLLLLRRQTSVHTFNKLKSAYYQIRFPLLQVPEDVHISSQRCYISPPKWLVICGVTLTHTELMFTPDRCSLAGTNCFLRQNEKSNSQHQCVLPWNSGYAGAWCVKKMPQMSFQLQVREGTGLCPPYGMVRCSAASHLLTCGRHPIIIHSLHFSQLIDVSTGADNPRLIYIWLWKSLNEFSANWPS